MDYTLLHSLWLQVLCATFLTSLFSTVAYEVTR